MLGSVVLLSEQADLSKRSGSVSDVDSESPVPPTRKVSFATNDGTASSWRGCLWSNKFEP